MGREFPSQPVVGVGAVVLRKGAEKDAFEVLLVRRANPPLQGEWSLPGGVVELGERLEEAVIREVLEETGLTVEVVAMAEVLDHIVRDEAATQIRFHYVLIDFACRVTGGRLAGASDALDVRWHAVGSLRGDGEFALRKKTLTVIRQAVSAYGHRIIKSD